jgi:hypothetical protein
MPWWQHVAVFVTRLGEHIMDYVIDPAVEARTGRVAAHRGLEPRHRPRRRALTSIIERTGMEDDDPLAQYRRPGARRAEKPAPPKPKSALKPYAAFDAKDKLLYRYPACAWRNPCADLFLFQTS